MIWKFFLYALCPHEEFNTDALSKLIPRWTAVQQRQGRRIISLDQGDDFLQGVRFVGGTDISYDGNRGVAGLVVYSYPEMRKVFSATDEVDVTVPYIPGFLDFREVPAMSKLVKRFKRYLNEADSKSPFVVLVDGNGVWHERRCGSASRLGLLTNTPTVGVAKSFYPLPELCSLSFDEEHSLCFEKRGDLYELVTDAVILKSSDVSKRPIYVSVGHKICIKSALEIVMRTCRHRIPLPIAAADTLTREVLSGSAKLGEWGLDDRSLKRLLRREP